MQRTRQAYKLIVLAAAFAALSCIPATAQEPLPPLRPAPIQDACTAFTGAASSAWQKMNLPEAERQYLLAVEESEREERSNLHLLFNLRTLGLFYHAQKKYPEAELAFGRAVTVAEETLGQDDPRVWDFMLRLGMAYEAEKRWPEAEAVYLRAMALFERQPESRKGSLRFVMEGLARVAKGQGRYEEAEALLRRAAELPAGSVPQGLVRASELIKIGRLHLSRKDRLRADEAIRQAFELLKEIDLAFLAGDGSLREIAFYYQNTGRDSEAEPAYLLLLTAQEASPGPGKINLTATLMGLGNIYFGANRLDEAEQMYRRALEAAPELKSRGIASSIVTRLAEITAARGRYAEAEEMLLKEWAREEAAAKEEATEQDSSLRPDPYIAALGLFRVYTRQGRMEEAESVLLRMIAEQEKNLASDNGDLEISLEHYARFLHKMKRTAEARAVEARLRRIYEKARN